MGRRARGNPASGSGPSPAEPRVRSGPRDECVLKTCVFRLRWLSYGGQVAPRNAEALRQSGMTFLRIVIPLYPFEHDLFGKPVPTFPDHALAHIKLLAEVIADLDDQRDAFGIAEFGDRRLVCRGAEFPGTAVAKNGNDDPVRTVGVNLQFGPCHRNKFGFGLGGLAHDGGFLRAVVLPQVAASASDCREDDLAAT